jgi:hypothetical protein
VARAKTFPAHHQAAAAMPFFRWFFQACGGGGIWHLADTMAARAEVWDVPSSALPFAAA